MDQRLQTASSLPAIAALTLMIFAARAEAGATLFGPQRIVQKTDTRAAISAIAADLDGDGDLDVISASILDDKIAWYENTDASGTFGPQHVINTPDPDADFLNRVNGDADNPLSVFAADLDGDGDFDVLSASADDDKIAWYENTDAMGTFGPQRAINIPDPDSDPTNSIDGDANGAASVFAADLDGDGDLDVLSASYWDDKIAWYENIDGMGTFGPQQTITTSADGAYSVFAADLDGDGDLDVLSASFIDDEIAWYENTDGMAAFGPQQTITASADGALSVFAADLDGDGDLDALSASSGDDKIAWYENTDGAGAFGPQRVITRSADSAWSVFAADLDGDGDLDVLSASHNDDKIAWHENTDGLGAFGPQQVIMGPTDHPLSVFGADLDGDGDCDVLSASLYDDKIAWYRNTDAMGTFGPQQTITASAKSPFSIFAADLDGDGDQDVLSASLEDHKIAWYENIDAMGAFGSQQVISTSVGHAISVFAADLDGDLDFDVLSASPAFDKIAWYENTDGLGAFGPPRVIPTSPDNAVSVFAADLDGDGDFDVLSASGHDNKIAWYENTDGLGTFGPQQTITTSARGARSVFAADLDGDGDLDVLSASAHDDKIAWYENTDGAGAFGPQQAINTPDPDSNPSNAVNGDANHARSVFAADLDGDGDFDVLSASFSDHKIAWYENTDAMGTFGPQQVITTSAAGAESVFAADLDGDGDQDVLSASSYFLVNKIAWYENTDGLGAFGPLQTITTSVKSAKSVLAADLDGDGDLDVLSASSDDDKIAWYENLTPPPNAVLHWEFYD